MKFWALLTGLLGFTQETTQSDKFALSDLYCVTYVRDDTWNGHKDGQIEKWWYIDEEEAKAVEEFRFRASHAIAYISYRPHVGQIGVIGIMNEEHRGMGMGKEMLRIAIEDTKRINKTTEIWAVTSENHPFWSNVWGGAFVRRSPAHDSVSGSGYYYDFSQNSAHETCSLHEDPDIPSK